VVICKTFPYVSFNFEKPCDTCHLAKQHKLPFQLSNTNTVKIFDLIHVDIWGLIAISSIHGHKYFLALVDDFSRYT